MIFDKFDGMNIFVSGGAGFIGSWLCETLLEAGSRVICADNFSRGGWQNIRHLKQNPDFVPIYYDIADTKIIEDFGIANFDIVIHAASPASPADFAKIPIGILDVNTVGTRNMLEIARRGDSRFLLCSSSEVYGDPPDDAFPHDEEYRGNVSTIGIRSPYDEGKRVAEAYTMAYLRTYGVDGRIARIHNTYGERQLNDGRVVPRFIIAALKDKPIPVHGTGEQTRSFLYIEDLIDGLAQMCLVDNIAGLPINLGSTNEMRIIDLANQIIDTTKSKSKIVHCDTLPDDPSRRIPSIRRAEELLRWKPAIEMDDGLSRTVEWWEERLGC